jgi:uncharacterized protein (TIGR00725 family)
MSTMPEKIIAVFGAGNVSERDREWETAFSIGRELATRGVIVLTGGLGGVMTAASKGAKEAGGTTVGILPGTRETSPANSFVDIAIYTGMGEARNAVNVKSCDAAIAIGGEYGTLSEIGLALKSNCPIILLNSWSLLSPGNKMQDWQIAEDLIAAVEKAIAAAG